MSTAAPKVRMLTITIAVPASLIDDVMANYPEASSQSLVCLGFSYKPCIFRFTDTETGKKYRVTRAMLEAGFRKMMKLCVSGQLPGIASEIMPNPADAGRWDSDCADALVQCAIFGEVIYG